MAAVTLFVAAAKLAGILVTVTVAANAFTFSSYRKKNLRPFVSPIDESSDTLAVFNVNPTEDGEAEFFFGLASAPAHVEDKLNDAWLQFAQEQKPSEQMEPQESPQSASVVIATTSADGGSQPALSSSRSLKKKKPLKLAMEAMIRGFEKYVETEEPAPKDDVPHKVAAWHNVTNP